EEACQGLRRGLDVALDCGYAMGLERILGVRARVTSHMAALPCVAELDERLSGVRQLSTRLASDPPPLPQ
ncbi:MAG: hypothetical protein ACRDZO_03210, partial [Egibacteraceae bacterium]